MARIDMTAPKADDLRSRLFNWKFSQAERYLEGQPDEVKQAVAMFSRMFENVGWEGGDIGHLLSLAMEALIGPGDSL